MENQIQNQEGARKARVKYAKILVGAAAVIALVLVAFAGLGMFKQWQMRKGVENFAETLKRLEQEDYRRAMADTYGGKTPQETLQMYIAAVEKGDYELASKYFIGEKQEKWRKELIEIKNVDKTDAFLNPIKVALHKEGEYSMDKKSFSIHEPIAIDFRLYPNGIWKLMEI